MNVLLTGGAGFIGSHVIIALIDAGYNPIIYDNLSNSSIKIIESLSILRPKKFHFVYGDINNTKLLTDTMLKFNIDAVIHLAGLKSVNESVHEPLKYYSQNVTGAINLFTSIKNTNIKKIIFSSSATVYGNPIKLPIDENHPVNPINPYGNSKLQIETILKDLCYSDLSLSVISLRYFNPVGAHTSGLIGESPEAKNINNLMPLISQVALGYRKVLDIYGNNYNTIDGTGIRDYIHIEDVAEGHVRALEYLNNNINYDYFNLGTGKPCTVLQLVKTFEKVNNIEIPFKFVSNRQGDLESCYAKVTKASSILKWEAKKSIQDMCSSEWFFKTNLTIKNRKLLK